MKISKNWWKTFFDPKIFTPGGKRHVQAAEHETRFIMRVLKLKKGSAILDLCCGTGRHSILLAKKGYGVVGLDYTPIYLRQARERARRARAHVDFIRGDMRKLRYTEEFDAVINCFTSFGYFPTNAKNQKVLAGISKALRPGGKFLLDVVNRGRLAKGLVPRNWGKVEDGGYVLEERKLIRGKKWAQNRWVKIFKNGKTMERSFINQLFDKAIITRMLARAGLKPISFWGDFKGAPYSEDSRRLIVLAKK
ncbi:class I SAM-dependent methyltransferase [Elusimicrobiota bacterium]